MRRALTALLPGIAAAILAAPASAWQANNDFFLEWNPIPGGSVGFRFVNVPWDAYPHFLSPIRRLDVGIPAPPGATKPPPGEYLVETWVSDADGFPGPHSTVALQLDDATPPPAQPTVPPGWLDGRSPTPVKIEHPAPPLPFSGIRGYALTVASRPGESPCALATRCGDAEIDLPFGIGDDTFHLGPLPDGIDYLTVVAVSGTGIASAPRSVALPVDAAPPAVSFTGVPAGWVNHPVTVGALAADPASGTAASGPSGAITAIAVDGAPPALAFGGDVETTVRGEGVHSLSTWARDALGNANSPAATPAARVLIDETSPRVAFTTAQRPGDPELIEVTVADALSGPSPDRGSIEVRPAGSRQRFERLPTRETADGLGARWSSDDYPAGSYEFRANGYDAAGNPTVTSNRPDGSPMVLRNPIKTPTAIASGFGGARLVWQHCHRVNGGRRCHREAVRSFESRPALWTVPFRRPLRFGGILRDAAGAPLGGQPVEVVETFAPGADAAQRRTTAMTDAEGRFGARLAPGPSRRVEALFPGNRTLTRAAGRSVTMAVRAGLRLTASTSAARIGGAPVLFSGRLFADEASIPRTGRPVQLQFRVPGGEWSEFRTVQTDRHGRFRYPYSFTDDDSRGIRFQFRAVSPEQADWPYRPGASRPVAVTGH